MAKLTVALIAIHGLGKKETTLLLLDDLDLSRGHLLVRRPTGRHTVYLDELSRTLVTSWLRERHRRWPLTANRHLLVTGQTAAPTPPPIAFTVLDAIFPKLGLSPSKLRQDRILDEARHTADPVHLMRVFGLTAKPRHVLRPGSPSRTPPEVNRVDTNPIAPDPPRQHARVPGIPAPGSSEPARFRLMHHAHVFGSAATASASPRPPQDKE